MINQRIWRKRILIPLWTIHLYYLSPALWQFITSVVRDDMRLLHLILFRVSFLTELVLEIIEIGLFMANSLPLGFYFCSQLFKSLFSSYACIHGMLNERRWLGYLSTWSVLASLTELLVFYVALGYAVYVWCHQRRLSSVSPGLAFDARIHLDGESTALTLPPRINSSSKIIADLPTTLRVLNWIYNDPKWSNSWPRWVTSVLFGSRYFIGVIVIATLLTVAKRLPGEPEANTTARNPNLDHWEYPQSRMPNDARQSSNDTTEQNLVQDEEASLDTLGLHWINPLLHSSTNPSGLPLVSTNTPAIGLLGPRYLCFLHENFSQPSCQQYTVRRVKDWIAENNVSAPPDYVFISYTRRQFYTVTKWNSEVIDRDLAHLRHAADRDKKSLTYYAILAAIEANVSAFWIDFECVKSEDNQIQTEDMEDVYRICDIVRAAHSMSIVVGPPLDENNNHVSSNLDQKASWLHEWGTRMWTVPEALLCPTEHRITLFFVGSNKAERVARRNLANRVWDDADSLQILVDHYEGSVVLTPLQLISHGLECLQRRVTHKRHEGDVAYVLMGLLRLRPKVNKFDSGFQAFARLSLSNDSSKILERILCVQSIKSHSDWHDMQDLWDLKLWHLDPLFHIADVDKSDSVIVGDALGTCIDWISLKPVDFATLDSASRRHWSWMRAASVFSVVFSIILPFALFIITPHLNRSASEKRSVFLLYGVILGFPLAISFGPTMMVPLWLSRHFKQPLTSTQARMFGLQGKPNLDEVEAFIFGAAKQRLRWNVNNLSKHFNNDDRPVFTLIDTLSCTATLFHASTPPTIAFVGGRDGGLLRVILCSYEALSGIFVKETIIRLDKDIIQRIPHLESFRFGVTSRLYRDEPLSRRSLESDMIDILDVPEFQSLEE